MLPISGMTLLTMLTARDGFPNPYRRVRVEQGERPHPGGELRPMAGPRRQRRPDLRGEVIAIAGSACDLGDVRPAAQFLEAQVRVHDARAVHVTVDEAVEEEAVVEATLPRARRPRGSPPR